MTKAQEIRIANAIHGLGNLIIEVNKSNGWDVTVEDDWNVAFAADEERKYKIPTKLALIHSEVSEALEAYRKNDMDGFLEEMADTVIRVVDCTHGLGLALGEAILQKIEKNRTRGFRHGNKIV